MPKVNLDAIFVRNATCETGKNKTDYYDTSITGFILEVRSSGGKTYSLRYRDPHGKLRQHKIGDAQSITFDKAKSAAIKLRSRVVLGESPAEEKKLLRTVPTVAELADRYMIFVRGYKRDFSGDDSYLRNHILPKWGRQHIDEVTQQSVIEFHHGMRASGYAPATANRVIILLRYMYNLAKKWKISGAENNPTAGVQLFECNNARERFLTTEETQRLIGALEGSDNPQLKYIVPILILTGMRKMELLKAQFQDIDIERKLWRIPLPKSGKARHVPLSDSVLQILAQLPRWEKCTYVVPNPKTKLPYVSIYHSWNTARKSVGMPELRMHDLRHSFASFLVNAGQSLYTVSNLLGHTQIKTTQRYSHLSTDTLLSAVGAMASAAGLSVAA
jgi:integrase